MFLYSSPSFGSVLAQPFSSFSPMLFWGWSLSAALQVLVPGVSPENRVPLGSKSTPCEAAGWSLSQAAGEADGTT